VVATREARRMEGKLASCRDRTCIIITIIIQTMKAWD
jgi:hypothetical protein